MNDTEGVNLLQLLFDQAVKYMFSCFSCPPFTSFYQQLTALRSCAGMISLVKLSLKALEQSKLYTVVCRYT